MSEERDYRLFLEDIIDAIKKIERYTEGLSSDEFRESEITIDATVRNLEIIGEAANKIPKDIKSKYPKVEWKEAVGFRNVLIHDYFGVDTDAVWDTIQNNLPVFKKHVKEVLDGEN